MLEPTNKERSSTTAVCVEPIAARTDESGATQRAPRPPIVLLNDIRELAYLTVRRFQGRSGGQKCPVL